MFRRTASRMALASVPVLIAGGALAAPAHAASVGPHQYFSGQVFGAVSSSATPNVIEVICAGPRATGHPATGQSVAVQLVVPTATTFGYTGNFGAQISADLTWSRGTVTVVTHIATFTSYGVKMPIPTSITVPCSGSGVMSFSPSPDPDNSGKASDVSVTFQSPGV